MSQLDDLVVIFKKSVLRDFLNVNMLLTVYNARNMDHLDLYSTVGFNPQFVTFKLYGMVQKGYTINLTDVPDGALLKIDHGYNMHKDQMRRDFVINRRYSTIAHKFTSCFATNYVIIC